MGEEDIQIKGYNALVPNDVFVREGEPIEYEKKEYTTTQITMLQRFKSSPMSDVMDFLIASAQDFPDDSTISTILEQLHREDIKAIANGDERALGHLSNHYPEDYEDGVEYLEVANGTVSNHVFLPIRKLAIASLAVPDVNLHDAFENFLAKNGVNNWYLRIKLNNGTFPELSHLEYLMTDKVRDSSTLYTNAHERDYSDIIGHVRLLHQTFSEKDLISRLGDFSEQALYEKIDGMIKNAAEYAERTNQSEENMFKPETLKEFNIEGGAGQN